MNWDAVIKNPWTQTVGGGLLVLFVGWLVRRFFNRRQDTPPPFIQQNASPVVTQTFNPTINIHSPATHPAPTGQPLPQLPQKSIVISGEPLSTNIEVCIIDAPDKGQGLLIAIINQRTINLRNFRLRVHDARSFDKRTSMFRDTFGFQAVMLKADSILLSGDKTTAAWLVRVQDGHLEVGDTVGAGVLRWPSGDNSDEQQWRLEITAESEDLAPLHFSVLINWESKSKLLKGRATHRVVIR